MFALAKDRSIILLDFDFIEKAQMARPRADTANPPPKRRKLNDTASEDRSEREDESSSDELAATSDYELERRRASWSAKKAVANRRQYNNQSNSPNGSDSPDELSMDADGPWNRNTREQSPTKNESAESDQHAETQEETDMKEEREEGEETGDFTPANDDTNNTESNDAHSPGQFEQPTTEPAPPPPPPKPDRVNYVQRHLLKGHLRGVSTVRFSPDRTMIASGGTLSMSLHLRRDKSLTSS